MLILLDDKKNVVVAERMVVLFVEHFYVYGVSKSILIYTNNPVYNLREVGRKYKLIIVRGKENSTEITVELTGISNAIIANDNVEQYTFLDLKGSQLSKNTIDRNSFINSVSFKDYVHTSKRQEDYYTFELRKKGLIQVYDKSTGSIKTDLLIKVLKSTPKDITSFSEVKISDIALPHASKKNYYTITSDGKVVQTKNGKGFAEYLPFATESQIRGLDNFIVASHELRIKSNIEIELGDMIVGDSKQNYIVLEKEVFNYKKGQVTTFIILGKKEKGA